MNTEDDISLNESELNSRLDIMQMVETELDAQKRDSIFCLTVFLCATSLWILLVALWEWLGQPVLPKYMTQGVEVIAVIMLVTILKFTRIRISKMGISKNNLRSTMIRDGIISAGIFLTMLSVKLITKPGQPVFNPDEINLLYPFTCVLQEFLCRGFLLTTLNTIYTGNKSKHLAVIASSLMFTSLHLHYGFLYMVGAGILSVILGYCYLKDKNIWGVSLIHFVFGMCGIVMELV